MRLLCSFAGGSGHLEPLLPIARAAAAAGHEVAVAGAPELAGEARRRGLAALPVGPPRGPRPAARAALAPVSAEREDRVLAEAFAGRVARERLLAMAALARAWRPDVVVCDETDFGAMLAAEQAGIPHAAVQVIASGAFVRPDVVAAPLDRLRAEHGLAPDPELAMPARHLLLSPVPPSFRDPGVPPPATLRPLRPTWVPPDGAAAPAWLDERGDDNAGEPLVLVTLGTVFNAESGDLLERLLAGAARLRVRVVATIGRDLDPSHLGPQPPRVRIERHVHQSFLLPRVAAVVSHAGSGSVLGALAHGVPSVLVPMGADQPHNGRRCAALGAGIVLDPLTATPAEVAAALAAVLEEPRWREAAEQVAREAAGRPAPEEAVRWLEELAGAEGGAAG